jgi:adenylylsulfate kinase
MSVVWLNGPVGAGKSTLAYAVRALVQPVAAVAMLDEDDVREALADATAWFEMDGVGDGAADGVWSTARLAGMARVLSQQGLVVVVAASAAPAAVLAWNRENLPGYREVYLRASPETIKHRARRRHAIDGATGSASLSSLPTAGPAIARVYTGPPLAPDLTLDMDNPEPPELLAFRVAVLIPEFVVAAAGAAAMGRNRLRRGA